MYAKNCNKFAWFFHIYSISTEQYCLITWLWANCLSCSHPLSFSICVCIYIFICICNSSFASASIFWPFGGLFPVLFAHRTISMPAHVDYFESLIICFMCFENTVFATFTQRNYIMFNIQVAVNFNVCLLNAKRKIHHFHCLQLNERIYLFACAFDLNRIGLNRNKHISKDYSWRLHKVLLLSRKKFS